MTGRTRGGRKNALLASAALLIIAVAIALVASRRPTSLPTKHATAAGAARHAGDESLPPPRPSPATLLQPARPARSTVSPEHERSSDGIETIEGRVVDVDGQPASRALVVLDGPEGAMRTVRTDADGRFQILRPDGATGLRVQHPSGWATVPLPAPSSNPPLITLAEGRTITGIVQTREGVPVPLAPVIWWVGEELSGAAQADIEGRFEIGGLPPSDAVSIAVASGYGSIEQSTVLVPPSETSATITIPDLSAVEAR